MTEQPSIQPGYETRLIQAREALTLTTAEASRRIGVVHSTWSRWERNEFGRPPDRTARLAMEYELGIRERWLLYAEEPMVRRPLAFDQLEGLDQVIYPDGSGMAPAMNSGDLLLVRKPLLGQDALVHGQLYLLAPEGGRATVGRAVHHPESRRWFLYHDEDRQTPSAVFPPEQLGHDDELREVVGVVRIFPEPQA